MVRLIENQADAFAYRRFGRRVFFTGLLVALLYGAAGAIVMSGSDFIEERTGMSSMKQKFSMESSEYKGYMVEGPVAGELRTKFKDSGKPLPAEAEIVAVDATTWEVWEFADGRQTNFKFEIRESGTKLVVYGPDFMKQIQGAFAFITFVFLPLAGSTMWYSRILKKGFKKMDAQRGVPMVMLSISRIIFLLCIAIALAPIGMIMDAPMTVMEFYQQRFMYWYFTLLGLGLAFVIMAPVLQLHQRTHSKKLHFAALLGLLAAGLLIFQAQSAIWDVSVFQLALKNVDQIDAFKESFVITMGICAAAIFISFTIMARNAGSILKRQRSHFFTHLGD